MTIFLTQGGSWGMLRQWAIRCLGRYCALSGKQEGIKNYYEGILYQQGP
jgi:hypothetical protein